MTQDQAAALYSATLTRGSWNREDFDAGWQACAVEVLLVCEEAEQFPRATAHGLARRLRALLVKSLAAQRAQ